MISLNFKEFFSPKNNNLFNFVEVKKNKLKPFREWFLENVNNFGPCPKCGKSLIIRKRKDNGNEFLACTGFPGCKYTTGYNPNMVQKPQLVQQPIQPKQGIQPQGIQRAKWFYADVIKKDDPRFKNEEKSPQ